MPQMPRRVATTSPGQINTNLVQPLLEAMRLMLQGQIISGIIVKTADAPQEVAHTLGAKPKSFSARVYASGVQVYALSEDETNWTDKKIVIRCNTAGAKLQLVVLA